MKHSTGHTDLLVRVLHVGEMASCCYIVGTKGGEGIIVDAGDESYRIVKAVSDTAITPKFIVLTHGHADHIGALDDLRAAFPAAQCCIHEDDAPMLDRPSLNLSLFLGRGFKRKLADRLLRHADTLEFTASPHPGPIRLNVIHVPGHTPGGICLHVPAAKIIFTGDVLFAGGIGRTDFPGGNTDLLLAGIREKLITLPPDTTIYPGHGPSSTIAVERDGNPFL